jgi:hypothetical protein
MTSAGCDVITESCLLGTLPATSTGDFDQFCIMQDLSLTFRRCPWQREIKRENRKEGTEKRRRKKRMDSPLHTFCHREQHNIVKDNTAERNSRSSRRFSRSRRKCSVTTRRPCPSLQHKASDRTTENAGTGSTSYCDSGLMKYDIPNA